ncbi:MAG: hypothetical protein EXS07_04505 [Gemmataceae bacterium]|nr:hypothetical protein [Gemmataceae bacterium]
MSVCYTIDKTRIGKSNRYGWWSLQGDYRGCNISIGTILQKDAQTCIVANVIARDGVAHREYPGNGNTILAGISNRISSGNISNRCFNNTITKGYCIA